MKVKVSQSCLTLWLHGLYSPWNSPGQNTGVGSLSLLQGIFQTQGSNPGILHCRWILYQLSHKRSPRILEWVAYPFSRGSSRPRNWTGVSCIAGGFLTNWAMWEGNEWMGLFLCQFEQPKILLYLGSVVSANWSSLSYSVLPIRSLDIRPKREWQPQDPEGPDS